MEVVDNKTDAAMTDAGQDNYPFNKNSVCPPTKSGYGQGGEPPRPVRNTDSELRKKRETKRGAVMNDTNEAKTNDREQQALLLGTLILELIDSSIPSVDTELPTKAVAASPHDWLFVEDIRKLFKCGDSKARAILRALPAQKIGKRTAVQRKDLDEYIAGHGGVEAKWPKRR